MFCINKSFTLKVLLLIFFMLVLFNFHTVNGYCDESKKNILIINSYHKGLIWTDDETDGINSILKSNEFNIAIEYMDWKNYPTNESLKYFHDYLKYKYQGRKIDVIITTDDAALEFALKNRTELLADTPVVFCGVNENGAEKITYGYSKVTGIIEETDPIKTVHSAIKINPDLDQIYLVFDNSESGLSTGNLTMKYIKEIVPNIKVNPLNDKNLSDILSEVRQAPKNSIVLLTTYYQDVDGTVVGFENSHELISKNSIVPVYSLYDFGMGRGVLGGSMLSGRLQGENAAKLALRVLNGESASLIPFQTSRTTRFIFDYLQLKRFNIPMKALPGDSEIINKPFSFFQTYKRLVLTVTASFIMLIVFIVILAFNLKKISAMKSELSLRNNELAKLYDELAASDEELQQQFDELSLVQKNLVSSENKFSMLFEKMLNGFFVAEPVLNSNEKITDIRFINVNPGFGRQTGIDISEIVGKTWLEVFKYPNLNLSNFKKIIDTGASEQFEVYYPQAGVYYLFNAFRTDENKIGVVFENITEYKVAIKEIRTLNDQLEERILERTNELNSAVSELESFTYTVSHDLKSPLRAIASYIRIFTEDYGSKLGIQERNIISSISIICKNMIDMIDKLLQYSTTSKLKLHKEEIDTEELFLSIFKELRLAQPGRKIRIVVETRLPLVSADKIMMRQAVYNILSNAIKFTKYKEEALIKVGCTLTETEYIFYVKDNGAGFDMEYSEKLFGLFQRLHTNDEFDGSGIGLITIKKIIQKHGGRTWIEGTSGIGATIYFTLPFAAEG